MASCGGCGQRRRIATTAVKQVAQGQFKAAAHSAKQFVASAQRSITKVVVRSPTVNRR